MSPVLQTRNLEIGYRLKTGEKVLASGLNLELGKGSFVALLGPNGSGKSTLIRTLSALLPALKGEVLINGTEVHQMDKVRRAQSIALVLTDNINNPGLSVFDMVAYGRFPFTNWLGKLSNKDEQIIRESLELVGMGAFAERQLLSLSDGEKQRVMIAKALAQQSDLMILDEPTAHLDLINRVEIMKLLRHLALEQKRAILISTHELDLAMQSADELWLMSGDKEIIRGMPEELILSGSMQKVFARSAVDFDHLSGIFKIRHDITREIRFSSDNAQMALWTRKAFEKLGVALSEEAKSDKKLEIRNGQWVYEERVFDSLDALVAMVKAGR